MKLQGVYKVTNIITGKIYVGSSLIIQNRSGAYNALPTVSNLELWKSYKEYGAESHRFEILEIVEGDKTEAELHEYERLYIQSFEANGFETFNVHYSNKAFSKMLRSRQLLKERKETTIPAPVGRKANQYLVTVYRHSPHEIMFDKVTIKEACEKLNVRRHTILTQLNGHCKSIFANIGGEKTRLVVEYSGERPPEYTYRYRTKSQIVRVCADTGIYLQLFESAAAAGRETKTPVSNIQAAANDRLLTAGKYKWVWLCDILNYSITDDEVELKDKLLSDTAEPKEDIFKELQQQHNKRKEFQNKFIKDVRDKVLGK